MGTMLEVRDLWAGYADFVVRDLSFSVAGGELVGILGRNGSGKSTLLRCINCLERAEKGKIILDGITTVSYTHLTLPTNSRV